MPYIDFKNTYPGIRGALAFRPEVASSLGELSDILLRGNSGLSRADRELIGMHVSKLNNCTYCMRSHAAIACVYLDNDQQLINDIQQDYKTAAISDKLKALLNIAGKVQQSGRAVTPADIKAARDLGASDLDIHDTVLIAALFCLFNRYVDGLATTIPADEESYKMRAMQVVENGYSGVTKSISKETESH
ncbi:MAG: peroxidase-related enzyme [Chitinophagaceae bacterium]|nr:peroxidase-related enzyme [Chitinophagaceae bacterium]